MQRITAIDPAEATGKTKKLLDGVQAKLGMTPNLMKTLASAPAALEAYLSFGAALGTGTLDAKFREQIAIAVAQANSCEYCLSAHTTIGKMVGLTPEEIASSRESHSADARTRRRPSVRASYRRATRRGFGRRLGQRSQGRLHRWRDHGDRRQCSSQHLHQLLQPRGADGSGFPARFACR